MPQSPLKKICFVVSDPITVNAFMELHFKYLSSFYEVHLVANLNHGSILNTSSIKTVQHIPLYRSIHPIKDLRALFALWKHFKTMQFDAVHCITPKAGLLGMLASKLAGIPIRIHIFTGQIWHTKTGISKWCFQQLDKLVVRLSTHILVDSHAQRDFLISQHILTAGNSQVLGKGSISGVSPCKFSPNPAIRKAFRNKYGVSDSDTVFAFLGRMNKDKGIFELITAFQKLNSRYSNTKLLFIGPDEQGIQSSIDASLSNQTIFIGHSNNPQDFLQMADAFCMPSHREGFGTSVMEASMLGLPVICSDTYGLSDAFIENQTGLKHTVGKTEALYQCMENLYLNPSLTKSMGNQAKQFALENFLADTVSTLWLKFYQHLFQQQKPVTI
ncbi:MAG: glycosyltransferase family 1 protein [Chitinophagaceae bacterium BSSC1]|nr:MAG: glycosyltransferase family 1 protein [Chitinophagaceae bacterium BSSC1]